LAQLPRRRFAVLMLDACQEALARWVAADRQWWPSVAVPGARLDSSRQKIDFRAKTPRHQRDSANGEPV
jgi:hypothetical protein